MFHFICWGYPFAFLIILGIVEPKITTRGSDLPWCFIDNQNMKQIIWGLFAVYIPLYLSWIFTCVFYWLARQRVEQAETRSKNPAAKQELLEVSRKLRLIPLLFVSLRLWGAVYRMIQYQEKDTMSGSMRWLAIMAAIGDPSQGAANALVFVIFTKKIRQSYHRLFSAIFCCRKNALNEETLLKDESSSAPIRRNSVSSSKDQPNSLSKTYSANTSSPFLDPRNLSRGPKKSTSSEPDFFLQKKSLSSLSENDFIFGTSASFTSSSTPSLSSSASSPTPSPDAAASNLVIYASSNSSLSPSTSSEALFPSSPSSTSTSSTGSDHAYITIPELVTEEVAKNNDNLDSPAIFSSPWANWLNKQKEQKKLEDFNLG